MPEIEIRRYRPEDLSGLLDTRRSSIGGVASRDYTPAQIAAWMQTFDDLDTQGRRFGESLTWVAMDGEALVGFTNLAGDGYLDCLFVHADHQGRGIAGALVAALEAEARARGLTRVQSEVSLTARAFFESKGYALVTPQKVTVAGQTFDNLRMEKRL